ncbi:cyclin-like protein [Dichotomocladium elegans]|nr:cyclin-like protein [Dichotomocladium elegans]
MTVDTSSERDFQIQPYQPNLNLILICPDCKDVPPNLMDEYANGDVVCGDCGLVLMDRIVDTRSEWRTFSNDEQEDPSRVGAAADPLLSVNQLDTLISQYDEGTDDARNLRKAHAQATTDKKIRDLESVYSKISAFCNAIALPKTVSDSAKQVYKCAKDDKVLHGKPIDTVVAACLFVGCRQENVTRTYREIAAITHVNAREIGRCQRALQKALNMPTSSAHPANLIPRFCSYLALPAYVQKAIIMLINSVVEHGILAGKSPLTTAAACIFFTCFLFRVPRAPKEIAAVCQITLPTLKSAYKFLYKERENLIDLDALCTGSQRDLSFDDLALP